jgi:hypothetical protein
MTRGDTSLAEKRVYDAAAGTTDLYVTSGTGVVRVTVSGDAIGEFGLVSRETARDVSVLRGQTNQNHLGSQIGVATDRDVVVAATDGAFEPTATGFGPAEAVSTDGSDLIAGGADGRIARLPDANPTAEWTRLGTVDDVRALSGPLVATAAGISRITSAGVEHAGLSDVTDIDTSGVPIAATQEGLYRLGNGWMRLLEGQFSVVATDGNEHGRVSGEDTDGEPQTLAHSGSDWETGWTDRQLPDDRSPVALSYGRGFVAAATANGVVCVDTGEGWRCRSVGIGDVTGLAVVNRE